VGANFGAQWRVNEQLTFGLAYRTESTVETRGRADGNANVQLARLGLGAARPDFHYDAEVTNVFPQSLAIGAEWRATKQWTVAAGVEWIDYSRTFDTLVVTLNNGTNRDLNGLTGDDDIHDEIPVDWRDQWIARIGAEYAFNEEWSGRIGYSWARSPLRSRTLSPLTALIPEHTITVGIGWQLAEWKADLAWEWQLAKSRTIRDSILAAGEYEGGELEVSLHVFGLTVTREF
jgi:long-subunit fatty acid transport protein